MILIISESNDKVTDNVIDWINKNKVTYIRLNETDFITSISIKKNIILEINKKILLDFSKITSVWYRRGGFRLKSLSQAGFKNLPLQYKNHLRSEWNILNAYLEEQLSKKKGIFNKKENLNKLLVLDLASDLGLKTPHFNIVDNRNEIPNSESIVKAISESFEMETETEYQTFFTETFDNSNNVPTYFFPTLFQEKIEKSYDIRTIFLKNKIWSMAMVDTEETDNIDFRKRYNYLKYLPLQLPKEIEKKLIELMSRLKLDYGAIDFVVKKNTNDIYFLEINTFGQFEMVSAPCNYNIEKYIANYLI